MAAFDDTGKLVALLQAGSSAEDSGLSFYRTPEGSGVLLIGSVAGPTELGDKKLEGGGRFMARLQCALLLVQGPVIFQILDLARVLLEVLAV